MSEEQQQLPTSKINRAMKFVKTGAKVGTNYLKHYVGRWAGSESSGDDLNKANAELIFKTMGELKGSALKLAQMLSMDKNILPEAYTEQFALSQYKAPPLSYPLVVKIFMQHFKKPPTEIFDEFSKEAVHAASIGQVHVAMLHGKKLAVKVQYPGVADSIVSDLQMVKPIALAIMNANEAEVEDHFKEIAARMLEETDYLLELDRSVSLSEKCRVLPNLRFTTYYPQYSCKRILTMEWMEGIPIREFVASNPSQLLRNKVGQAIWDFYTYQVHQLHIFHADPHPGNFLIDESGNVGIIDFGCVKQLPEPFYHSHMRLLEKDIIYHDEKLRQLLKELQIIHDDDPVRVQQFLFDYLSKTIRHVTQPFFTDYFDFGNQQFIKDIINTDELLQLKKELIQSRRSRGQRDALYLHRTFYGLFNILHELKAVVKTRFHRP
jgi:predicted unusual protein kinase regulating ubiquinone biosynthesis (AarF/ABC1/UbiB family)